MISLNFAPSTHEPARSGRFVAAMNVATSAVLDSGVVLEESLVADVRAGLTPSEMVERKLASLLKSSPLPISHFRTGQRSRFEP